MSVVDQLASEQFVLLTTFRRDGRGVPTPVWAAPFDGGLGVWTAGGSGKIKRIRRNGHVTLAPCDRRGRPTGDSVPAVASLLDGAAVDQVRAAVARKYGILGWILTTTSRLRRGASGTAGIVVRAAA